MLQAFVEQMMGTEVDDLCGAVYGERSPERVNARNGYRTRQWDTRAGSIELQIPRVRQGSYYPGLLLEAPPTGGVGPGQRCCPIAGLIFLLPLPAALQTRGCP